MSTMIRNANAGGHFSPEDERRGDVLKLILYDLNSAIAPREHRLMALRTAVAEFDHDDEYKHDEELDLHADKILFQKLAFAFQVDRSSDEVALICTALEMVYRASRARIALSFSELRESILPLFVEMLGKPLHERRQEELRDALQELSIAKEKKITATAAVHDGNYSESLSSPRDQSRVSESLEATLESSNVQADGSITSEDNTFGISTKADDTYLKDGSTTLSRSTYEVETVLSENTDDDSYAASSSYSKHCGDEQELETVMEGDEDAASSIVSSKMSHKTVGTKHSQSSNNETSVTSAKGLRDMLKEREKRGQEEMHQIRNELDMIRVEDPANDIAVSQLLQVLRYFSRVLSAMVPMAYHPGLLDALVYQLHRQRSTGEGEFGEDEFKSREEEAEQTASRVDAIATIVNLACAEENKVKMVHHKGLLDAVIRLALNDPSEESREHAAIVVMNLAYADENKVTMVEHDGMLGILVHLISDKSPFTRRYASAAMFTLACVVANTERMASHCDGEVLEALRRVLADDPVDEARINAAEALFNMARNNTEETVQTMGNHPRLFESIARAVLTDYSADVRVYCARALEWMAADVHYPMECHRTMLSALTVSSQWTKTSCIAEAFKSQSTLSENRRSMAMHDGLLKALANLAMLEGMNDMDTRASAIASLEMVSREPAARKFMVQNELVMTALTHASFKKEIAGQEREGSPSCLVKDALKNLAEAM